jgi:hypothetical protein
MTGSSVSDRVTLEYLAERILRVPVSCGKQPIREGFITAADYCRDWGGLFRSALDIARRLAECAYGDALGPNLPTGHSLHENPGRSTVLSMRVMTSSLFGYFRKGMSGLSWA